MKHQETQICSFSSLGDWPESDLESLGHCPNCICSSRTLRFDALEDWSFGVAAGKWRLWECEKCFINYLDPRPSSVSIGRAYKDYYTHSSEKQKNLALNTPGSSRNSRFLDKFKAHLKLAIKQHYLSVQFGQRESNLAKLEKLFLSRIRSKTNGIDLSIRHLPVALAAGERFLDIGCGDGEFLERAIGLGYEAVGIDPDPVAVLRANSFGLSVFQQSLPNTEFSDASFEQITLNHVIEHVHDPAASLGEVNRLLTPGGRVWMATPNLDSATLDLVGRYWRGLETPRHLCLFTPKSINQLLARLGFENIRFHVHPPTARFFVQQSIDQMSGRLPYVDPPSKLSRRWERTIRNLERLAIRDPGIADIMVISACRRKETR